MEMPHDDKRRKEDSRMREEKKKNGKIRFHDESARERKKGIIGNFFASWPSFLVVARSCSDEFIKSKGLFFILQGSN